MRSMYAIYNDIRKDYYLLKASEALVAAGECIGTDKFNLWMELYSEYMDKAISLYS